jgi:cellobiose phosphorylase
MRPNADGLVIDPSIPHEWDGFNIEKNFRGKHISIDIKNPHHVQSGVKEMTVNGEKVQGNFLSADKLTDVTKVEVILG